MVFDTDFLDVGNVVVDFDIPWVAGSVPAVPQGEVALLHTSVGPALFDTGGSPVTLVARSVIDSLGARYCTVAPCTPLELGGTGVGSCVHGTLRSSAAFQITVQFSFLEKGMAERGLPPFAQEVGAVITAYVVEDAQLVALQGAHTVPPVLLLGSDALKVRALERLFDLVLRAGFSRLSDHFCGLWTHPQRRKAELAVRGTRARVVRQGPDFPVEVPFDVRPFELSEDLGAISPVLGIFGRDGPPRPDVSDWRAQPERRANAGIPGSRSELRERLLGTKMPKSAYFDAYLEELVDILWKHRAVCGDPAPTGIPLSFEVDETLPPVRDGLFRHTAEEARAALWGEAMKLSRGGFIERVEAGPNGAPPADFYVNPIVCAFKQPDPGAPADAPAPIRFCLDMSILNKRLKGYTLTHLPDLADYMTSFLGKALFTNADLSQAFHQRPVAQSLRRFLGFSVVDPATLQRTYWQYNCGIFGLQSIPGDFQDCMEKLMAATCLEDVLTALRVFIDNLDVSTALPAGARDPRAPSDPLSPAGRELALRHLRVVDSMLAALVRGGFTINLRKSYFLGTEYHSMGVVGDGVARRIDPARLRAWESFSVPPSPSLKWLRNIIGMIVYAAPYVHAPGAGFMDLMDPLYTLLATASNLQRDAKKDKGLRAAARSAVSAGWTQTHTDSVVRLKDYIVANSTLQYPDLTLEMAVTCDAGDAGFCCTASQFDKVTGAPRFVFVLAHRWSEGQRHWSIGVRELFGWLCFMRKHWKWLCMARCVFRGDHLNHLTVEDLEHSFVKRQLCELLLWPDFRRRFHVRGEVNTVCDFFSRYADQAPTLLDAAMVLHDGSPSPPTYYFGFPAPRGAAVRRVVLGGTELADLTLLFAQGAETAGVVVRRVSQTATAGGLVEHFNLHRPSFSPLFLRIIEAQGRMDEAARAQFSALRKASTISLGGHSILLVAGRVFVPPDAAELREYIFSRLLHNGGTLHCGLAKASVMLERQGIFIPGFAGSYQAFYDSCTCQHARVPAGVREVGALVPTPRFPPLEHIMMDFCTLILSREGFIGLCITVDLASRAAVFFPVRDFPAASASAALSDWARRWGYPLVIHSDGGPAFASAEFEKFAAGHGALPDIGTPRHPRGRGQVEGLVGRVKRALRSLLPQGQLEN